MKSMYYPELYKPQSPLLKFQGIIKYLIVFILGLIILGVFFAFFGEWFLPIILMVAVAAMLYFTGIVHQIPPWQSMCFIYSGFFAGYVIQKISVVVLSVTNGEGLATLLGPIDTMIIALGIAILIVTIYQATTGKMFVRRVRRKR